MNRPESRKCIILVLLMGVFLSGCRIPADSMRLNDGHRIKVSVSENRFADRKENVAAETRELKLGEEEEDGDLVTVPEPYGKPGISILGNLAPGLPEAVPVGVSGTGFTVTLYSFCTEQVITDIQKNNIYTAVVNAVSINPNLIPGEYFTEDQLSAFRLMDLSADIVLPPDTYLYVAVLGRDIEVLSIRLYESAARTVITTPEGTFNLLMTQMELNEMAQAMKGL